MNLYEIITGGWGESYLRAYAWAESEEQALKMGEKAYGMSFKTPFDDKRLIVKIRLLFSADAEPFCTPFSDTGFDDE